MTKVLIIALILYSCISIFVIYLISKNISSEQAVTQTGILFATIIPVLISVSIFLKSEEYNKRFIYSIAFNKNMKEYVPVSHEQFVGDFNMKSYEESYDNSINIIERNIIYLLKHQFRFNWDINYEEYELKFPVGISGIGIGNSNSKNEGVNYGVEKLSKLFKHNSMLGTISLHPEMFVIPPYTKMETKQKDNARYIIFNNSKFGKVIIEIREANDIRNSQSHLNYYNYHVILDVKGDKWNSMSKEFKSFRNWYLNIDKMLSKHNLILQKKKYDY